MALNVNRWLQYAKARIDSAVGSGHEELDRLEAEQEAERADKPWLASDSTAPTFDEARARIEWEADQQAKRAAGHRDGGPSNDDQSASKEPEADRGPSEAADAGLPSTRRTAATTDPAGDDPNRAANAPAETGPAPRSPQQIAEDAERETARLELEDRQRKSAERLDQIRRELGIDEPPTT